MCDLQDTTTGKTSVNERRLLLAILAVSVALRFGAALYLGNDVEALPGTADQISYHTLSLRLLDGHGFAFDEPWWPATRAGAPTAHWSYLYTAYLAAVYAVFGSNPLAARLIQAMLVGLLQPYIIFRLGKMVFGAGAGLAGAALTAIYAYFVYYAAALMTESFYFVLILLSLYQAIRLVLGSRDGQRAGSSGSYLLAGSLGLSLGGAALLRQVVLLFVPVLLLWVFLASRNYQSRSSIGRSFAVTLAGLAVVILPVTAFNTSRFGRPVLINTNAGFAFFWANHPIHGTRFQPILDPQTSTYMELIPPELSHMGEAELDAELLRRGLNFVRADPARYFLLSLSRVPAYFSFMPSSESGSVSNLARVASFGILSPLMLYGVVLALLSRSPYGAGLTSPVGLLLLWVLCYSAIHVLSWSLVRYRLPVDAVLLVFVGLAAQDFVDRAQPWLRPITEPEPGHFGRREA